MLAGQPLLCIYLPVLNLTLTFKEVKANEVKVGDLAVYDDYKHIMIVSNLVNGNRQINPIFTK